MNLVVLLSLANCFLTQSLANSFLTQSLAYSPTYQSLTYSLSHSQNHLVTHLLTQSLTCSLTHLLSQSLRGVTVFCNYVERLYQFRAFYSNLRYPSVRFYSFSFSLSLLPSFLFVLFSLTTASNLLFFILFLDASFSIKAKYEIQS